MINTEDMYNEYEKIENVVNSEKTQGTIGTIIMTIALVLFIFSFSIMIPIIWRGFYYQHIDKLDLVKESGFSREKIVMAYDAVVDYCVNTSQEFTTAGIPYTEDGKSHFKDVRGLFTLNKKVLLISAVLLLTAGKIKYRKDSDSRYYISIKPRRIKGRSYMFFASVIVLCLLSIVGLGIVINFENAFVKFHQILFPGKSNWVFDWDKDPICRILPEEYFRNCALLIIGVSVVLCGIFILIDFMGARGEKE